MLTTTRSGFEHPNCPAARSTLERCSVGNSEIVTIDGSVHLALDVAEAAILDDLDGTTTRDDLQRRHGPATADLLDEFDRAGFLVGSTPFNEPKITISEAGVEFDGFDRIVAALDRSIGTLLTGRAWVALAAAVAVVGPVALATAPAAPTWSGTTTLAALVIWELVAVMSHELGHAMVLHRAGRRVGRAGFGLHWGAICFFVDATDALFLPRRTRVIQALAGPAVDVTLAGVLALAAAIIAPSPAASLLAQMAVMGWISALINLSPVLGLDGQHVVADLMDTADLHHRSLQALRRFCRHPRSDDLPLALYAAAALTIGVLAIGAAVVLWATVYLDVIAGAWNEGHLGMAVTIAFVGPTLAGLTAAAIHRLREAAGR